MARIGIDLDGCVYDFGRSVQHFLISRKGWLPEECPDPTTWHFFSHQWGITVEQFLELCNEGVDEGIIFGHGEPTFGSVRSLRRLQEAGHTLHIITDRHFGQPGSSRKVTERWLATYDVPYDSLHFSADKTVVATDIFIEDRPDNFVDLEAEGVRAYLMDRPWNRDMETPYRVHSWEEFTEAALVHAADVDSADVVDISSDAPAPGFASETRVVSETGGAKGQKDVQMSQIPVEFLRDLGRVFAFGASKYARFNFMRGYDWHLSYDAMLRHLTAFWAGEWLDPESGLPHLAHAAWHCSVLHTFHTQGIGRDTRFPTPEDLAW